MKIWYKYIYYWLDFNFTVCQFLLSSNLFRLIENHYPAGPTFTQMCRSPFVFPSYSSVLQGKQVYFSKETALYLFTKYIYKGDRVKYFFFACALD